MIYDPRKKTPLFSKDWTQMDDSKAFFQRAVYEYPVEGITTHNENHHHEYQVDANGNGWTMEYFVPADPRIRHKHEVKNWVVQNAQSNCWPNCEEDYPPAPGNDPNSGVPAHTHLFSPVDTQGNNVQTLIHPDRYSVVIITDEITTTSDSGGDRLVEIQNNAIGPGFAALLKFYNKVDKSGTETVADELIIEDWYLSERPLSKIKILLSISMDKLDGLNNQPPPEIIPKATDEIYLNTSNLEKKVNGVISLLRKYEAEIQGQFHGKVSGLDLPYQIKLLSQFVPQLATLIQSNGYTYDRSNSDLVALGTDSDYNLLYAQWNPGACFKLLNVNFNKFQESPPASNKETVNFLLKLDEIYEIFNKSQPYSWSDFVGSYMINPPEIDFLQLPRHSCPMPEKTAGIIKEAAKRGIETDKQREAITNWLGDPVTLVDMKRNLDSAAEFVGDTMVGGLGSVVDGLNWLGQAGDAMTNPGKHMSDGVWRDILNKIPIQNLIAAAMECLGFRGFEYINLAKQFLNQTSGYLEDVAQLFDIPVLDFPDDFPITDYMADLGKKIGEALLNAVMSVLIETLVGIIEQLLNLCNECALQNEAAGLARHDGLNFGGLSVDDFAGSFGEALVGGTLGTLSQTLKTGTGMEKAAAQLHAETEAHAKNPLLIVDAPTAIGENPFAGDADFLPDEETRKEVQQKAEDTKNEFASFARATDSVLTPGEMGNMLLGCGGAPEALNAVEGLLKSGAFPKIEAIAAADPGDNKRFITKMFAEFGKLLGPVPILQKVKEVTEAIPVELQCLTDADDLALRKQLLAKKGLTPSQVEEQVKKSQDRKKKKLKELSALLEKDNILEGAIPDIYCKMVFRKTDGSIVPNEKVIVDPTPGSLGQEQWMEKGTGEKLFRGTKPGLIEKDHPTFTFMMNMTLETMFDGITMSFSEDVTNFVPALTKGTTVEREVPRTKLAWINHRMEIIINPEWMSMVKDPKLAYEFGALPAESVVPGGTYRYTYDIEGDGDIFDIRLFQKDGDFSKDDSGHYLGHDRELSRNQNILMTAGQMGMGGKMPTGEQERVWEIAQRRMEPGNMKGRRRITEYGQNNNQRRLADYTKKFGYSPVPVIVKEAGPYELAPGLRGAFKRMCVVEDLFSVYPWEEQYQVYSFMVPNNLFEGAGIDFNKLKDALDKTQDADIEGGAIGAGHGGTTAGAFTAGASATQQALEFLNSSEISLKYIVPFAVPYDNGIPKDTYDVTLTMQASLEGSYKTPALVLYRSEEEKILKPPVANVLHSINLPPRPDDGDLIVPQERYFTAWNQKIWQAGGTIYQNGQVLADGDRPSYAQGLQMRAFDWSNLKEFYLRKQFGGSLGPASSSYDCLWKDFYCSLSNNIADSPFLDLKKIAALNLVPMNEMGQECDLGQGLLDVELIKERVKQEYSLNKCIELCLPATGGGDVRNNAFESAGLGGAVLLIIRTYVIEILMRSIFSFYYFRYDSADSVDPLLLSYIIQNIKKDITEKKFIEEFAQETIKLYNRNAPNMDPPRSQLRLPVVGNVNIPDDEADAALFEVAERSRRITDSGFDFALEYFTRLQVFGVSERLTKIVGAMGDTSLDSILVEEWMPSYPVPAEIGSRVLGKDLPEPPDPTGQTVPASKTLALIGQGTLTEPEIRLFNWNGPAAGGVGINSYTYRYPMGFLFRKYYAWPKRNISQTDMGKDPVGYGAAGRPEPNERIWSMDAPIDLSTAKHTSTSTVAASSGPGGAATFPPERAGWLGTGKRADISKSKIHPPHDPPMERQFNSREWWTLYHAGFIEAATTAGAGFTHSMKFSNLGKSALTPESWHDHFGSGSVAEPWGDPDTPYEFGVSSYEEKAMAVYLRMIAAPLYARASSAALMSGGSRIQHLPPAYDSVSPSNYAFTYPVTATGQYPATTVIYPGFFLNNYDFGAEAREWEQITRASLGRSAARMVSAILELMEDFTSSADEDSIVAHLEWLMGRSGYIEYFLMTWNHSSDVRAWVPDFQSVAASPDGFRKALKAELAIAARLARAKKILEDAPRWGEGDPATVHGTRPPDDAWREMRGQPTEPFGLTNRVGASANGHQIQNLRRAMDLRWIGMPYLSLLDFDMDSIRSILIWEKGEFMRTYGVNESHAGVEHYNRWINDIAGATGDENSVDRLFGRAAGAREDMATRLRQQVSIGGIARREMPYNPGESFENGNFITEFYLRIKELPYQGMPFENLQEQQPGGGWNVEWQERTTDAQGQPVVRTRQEFVDSFRHKMQTDPTYRQSGNQFMIPIEEAKWKNSNFVDGGTRTEFLKGVVNIEKFQEYITERFNENGSPNTTGIPLNCHPEKLRKLLIREFAEYASCGEQQAKSMGIIEEGADWLLSDFFEKVSVGVRISYVTPMKDNEFIENLQSRDFQQGGQGFTAKSMCWRYHPSDFAWRDLRDPTTNPVQPPFAEIRQWSPTNGQVGGTWEDVAMKEKALFVKEFCNAENDKCNVRGERWAHVVPIVSVEQEIPGETLMREVRREDIIRQIWNDQTNQPATDTVGFFTNEYYERLLGDDGLYADLKKTDEFKGLFKYMFPLDRMLSLCNVYSSAYLASFKDIPGLFDGTIVILKRLFFALLHSGNPFAGDCGPSSKDMAIASINGMDLEGLAKTLALMAVKAAMLVFKGFTEIFDTNIAISRKIVDAVHLTNKLIAAAQASANQAQQIAASIAAMAEGGGGEIDPLTCEKVSVPAKPPDSWFDPVEDNLIPEPDIWMISLAMLPVTLLPMFWPGIPITPFGLAYWGLDLKPAPNWLQDLEWPEKLLNKDEDIQQPSPGDEKKPCGSIDSGLPPFAGPAADVGTNNGGE